MDSDTLAPVDAFDEDGTSLTSSRHLEGQAFFPRFGICHLSDILRLMR